MVCIQYNNVQKKKVINLIQIQISKKISSSSMRVSWLTLKNRSTFSASHRVSGSISQQPSFIIYLFIILYLFNLFVFWEKEMKREGIGNSHKRTCQARGSFLIAKVTSSGLVTIFFNADLSNEPFQTISMQTFWFIEQNWSNSKKKKKKKKKKKEK